MRWASRRGAIRTTSLPWPATLPKERHLPLRARSETASASKVLRWDVAALLTLSSVFAAYWSTCSLLIHRSYRSHGWDLGLIHQVVWNSAHGRLFHCTLRDITYCGRPLAALRPTHACPLEWLTRRAGTPCIVVQAVAFALATVPLYAAARGIGCTAWQAFSDLARPTC